MKKTLLMASIVLSAACGTVPESVDHPDATREEICRVEPLSWWVGMKTSLQLKTRASSNPSMTDDPIQAGR